MPEPRDAVVDAPGTDRRWVRTIVDWVPLLLILVAYDLLRDAADGLVSRAHVDPQLAVDRWLGGGTVPNALVQQRFWRPDHPHWWDFLALGVYVTHFFAAITVAVVLWLRAYPRFRHYTAFFVTLTFAGFLTYLAYPAIPPWLAVSNGDLRGVVRIVPALWDHVGIHAIARVFQEQGNYSNPVGALPSLHAANPMLLLLFFWAGAGRWRGALVAYVVAMGAALVYLGEHYVFDIAIGWAYAVIVFLVVSRILDRRHRPDAPPSPVP